MKQKEKNKQNQPSAQQIVNDYVLESSNETDPLGSYTGKPLNPEDLPTQDADDL